MQYMIIPDVHGRTAWYEPVHSFLSQQQGHVVFLGDYNDSFDVTDQQMLGNFTDIILLKEQYPQQVTLLLGNHCFPYLTAFYTCSGNRKSIWHALNILYRKHLHLFQIALQVGNTLFVHAGITNGWLEHNRQAIEQRFLTTLEDYLVVHNYADLLDNIFCTPDRLLLWQVSRLHGGWDYYDSPIWVRPRHLLYDCLPGIHQVVGHTHMPKVVTEQHPDSGGSVTFTDTMENTNWQPLILDL